MTSLIKTMYNNQNLNKILKIIRAKDEKNEPNSIYKSFNKIFN